MSSMQPILRTLRLRQPARHVASYHVIVSSAERPIEIVTAEGRERLSIDAITAAFVGPLPLESLAQDIPGSAAPLVIQIPSALANRWPLPYTEWSVPRGRVLRRSVVMSTDA